MAPAVLLRLVASITKKLFENCSGDSGYLPVGLPGGFLRRGFRIEPDGLLYLILDEEEKNE